MKERKLKLVSSTGGAPRQGANPRRSKREAVLAEAAGMFNRSGIAGVSLRELAERLGMGRATLYHYVDDREDLVFQCYQGACEVMADHLSHGEDQSGAGLDKICAFVRRALDADAPATAAITDLAYLSDGPRKIIARAWRRNVDTLKDLLRAGIEDRSIRRCDEEIVANAILGILVWAPLSPNWLGDASFAPNPDAIVDFLRRGSAADPAFTFECPLDVASFSRLQAAGFDRKSVSDMRVEQILTTASRLFNQRGIDAVSLDDIVAALGATKGAFYHYLADKDELVARCYARANDLYARFVEAAEAHGRNGIEKASIGTHLNIQAQAGPLAPLGFWSGAESLPARQRAKQRAHTRQLVARFTALAEEGVADGSRRPHDINTIVVVRAGAFFWIPKWVQSEAAPAPRRIADEITALFNHGLGRRP